MESFQPQKEAQQYGKTPSMLIPVIVSVAASVAASVCTHISLKLLHGLRTKRRERSFSKWEQVNPSLFSRSPLSNVKN